MDFYCLTLGEVIDAINAHQIDRYWTMRVHGEYMRMHVGIIMVNLQGLFSKSRKPLKPESIWPMPWDKNAKPLKVENLPSFEDMDKWFDEVTSNGKK